jgi:ubiquinone/menaquinone biosynthesis C-methylase UbiE
MTFPRNFPIITTAFLLTFAVAATDTTTLAQDVSLKPGINDSYMNPDVEQRVQQFEGESREISQKRNKIVKACQLKRGMDVADIGAGTGLFTRLFAAKVKSKGVVYAVDISDKFIEHILKTSKEQNLKNVKGILCSQDATKLPPNSIDLAFICDTYHHFEFPFKTMATVHKALRPGGRLIVIDFKKIEGTTRDWIMDHVRGDQELTTKEIVEAGFELIDTVDIMEEQYVLRFKKK